MDKTMFRSMVQICRKHWLALVVFLVGGISQTFIGLYAITFFQRLLDGVVVAQRFSDLADTLFWYVGLTVANHVLIYLEGYPRSVLNNGAYMWAKLRAMAKVSRIDFLSYQDLGTGQLIQIVENGAMATQNILNGFYLNIVRGIVPQLIISFILIRYYDHTLFVVILGLYAMLFALSYYLMLSLRREMEKMLSSQERFARFSARGFMELVIFRINGRFRKELERIQRISDGIVRSRAKIYLVQELFFTGFAVLVFALQVGVVAQQANKIIAGASTVGTLVALVTFIGHVTSPISHFSVAYVSYRIERVAFSRFGQFLALPEDTGLDVQSTIRVDKGEVEFRDVTFSFQDRTILRDFTLVLEGGKTTALVGTSGSGKSTVVRLLLHLLKPDCGQVLVDGQDLAQVNLASFYEQVAYIPQEPPVFDGSIRENMAFDEHVADDRIEEVIRQVGLTDWIDKLPDGLETIVGERGIKLSGGERQRLAFARVLIQDPRIVIMDEPTASLDSVTEHLVTQNLAQFWVGKTVVVIAHRLQTVRGADQIVVLDDGAIVERGMFDDLIAIGGRFRQLWEEQTRRSRVEEMEEKADLTIGTVGL